MVLMEIVIYTSWGSTPYHLQSFVKIFSSKRCLHLFAQAVLLILIESIP